MDYAVAATLVQVVMGGGAVALSFSIGWVMRGERERQRAVRARQRRSAVEEKRETVARPGTRPARVSRATLDRAKVVQPDEN